MKENGIYDQVFKMDEAIKIDAIHKAVVKGQIDKAVRNVDILAEQLRDWFGVLNYTFEGHEEERPSFFEWVINVPARRGYDRIFVRGVCEEVELSHVETLQQGTREHKCDEGWIITTRRISQAVRTNASKEEHRNWFCYTFDELLDEKADFTGYLDWLEAHIKEKGIDKKYIPLGCKKNEFEPSSNKKIGESVYDKTNGWIESYIDRWLDDPAKKHISVLGEFGTGKTWFAQHYSWVLIEKYKKAKSKGVARPRLPIYIPLRDYAKAVTVESLFSEFFFVSTKFRYLGMQLLSN